MKKTITIFLFFTFSFFAHSQTFHDIFTPSLLGLKETDFSFMIFDRWGVLILETDNLNNAHWDGTYKGIDASIDTYV